MYLNRSTGSRRFKLGVVRGTYEHVQPEIKGNFEQSIKVLSTLAEVTQGVEFPDFP